MVLGNSLRETLTEFNSLNCPVCQYPYSSSERGSKPYMINCGHTACGSCIEIHRTCVVCNQSCVPGFQSVNYNLIDVVEEVNKVANEEKEFSVQCSKCCDWVKMDRSRICKTCFAATEIFTDDVASCDDAEIAPYVFCSSCAIDDHIDIEEKHDVIKYTQWKNRQLMSSATESAYGNVERIVELCKNELENGKKRLREWSEAVVSAENAGISAQSVKRCKRLAERCERYGETIYDFVDMNVLPALRRLTATMETATANLRADILLREDEDDMPTSIARRVSPRSRSPVVDAVVAGANVGVVTEEPVADAVVGSEEPVAAAIVENVEVPQPAPSGPPDTNAGQAAAAEDDLSEWVANNRFFRRCSSAPELRKPGDDDEDSDSSEASSGWDSSDVDDSWSNADSSPGPKKSKFDL